MFISENRLSMSKVMPGRFTLFGLSVDFVASQNHLDAKQDLYLSSDEVLEGDTDPIGSPDMGMILVSINLVWTKMNGGVD